MRVLRSVAPIAPKRNDLILQMSSGGSMDDDDMGPPVLDATGVMSTRRSVPVVNTVMRDRVVASVMARVS